MSAEKRKKKNALPVIIVLVIVLLIAGTGFFLWGGSRSTTLNEAVVLEIPEGSSAKTVAGILKDNDLIMNEISFVLYIRMNDADDKIIPGTYTFDPGKVTYGSLLSKLKTGDVIANTVNVTIPEGYTVWQIADLLGQNNLVNRDDFLNYLSTAPVQYEYIPEGNDYTKFEGFLFPETYNIGKSWDSAKILNLLLREFDKNWTEERQDKADSLGLTVKEAVTVASLIEREAKVDSERPVIASVIYNRLKADMPLQIDATVQYALGGQKERLYYSDLEIDSPYNTYKYKGLPVGPIASPGLSSIDAALNPADTTYLFYQTTEAGDGSHYFCNTYEEHAAYSAQKNK